MRTTFLDKKDNKNSILKKTILRLCIQSGEYSIAALSEQINTSVPTVTKLIGELMDEGFMIELGKSGTSGGRRPSIYGLNPEAGYFIGLDIRHTHASIAVTDLSRSPTSRAASSASRTTFPSSWKSMKPASTPSRRTSAISSWSTTWTGTASSEWASVSPAA